MVCFVRSLFENLSHAVVAIMFSWLYFLFDILPTLITAVLSAVAVTFIRTASKKLFSDDSKKPHVEVHVNVATPVPDYMHAHRAPSTIAEDIDISDDNLLLASEPRQRQLAPQSSVSQPISSTSSTVPSSQPPTAPVSQLRTRVSYRMAENRGAGDRGGVSGRWTSVWSRIKEWHAGISRLPKDRLIVYFIGLQIAFMLIAGSRSVILQAYELEQVKSEMNGVSKYSSRYAELRSTQNELMEQSPQRAFLQGVIVKYDPIGIVVPIFRTIMAYGVMTAVYFVIALLKYRFAYVAVAVAGLLWFVDQRWIDGAFNYIRPYVQESRFVNYILAYMRDAQRRYWPHRSAKKLI